MTCTGVYFGYFVNSVTARQLLREDGKRRVRPTILGRSPYQAENETGLIRRPGVWNSSRSLLLWRRARCVVVNAQAHLECPANEIGIVSSKQKQQADRKHAPSSEVGQRQEVERLIAKDRLKDAVKQAKLCYKAAASTENHHLLERAYYLRADQLRRNGMPAAAVEVAHHLLEFGVTDPKLVEPTARLLVALGMSKSAQAIEGRIESPETREQLALDAADQAVLHPDRTTEAPAELRAGAARVRQALDALHAGDEAKAMEALRDVSRSSPFSDWKLFVRGLAARSRHAEDEVRANWDRLDSRRAPFRIVRSLEALSAQTPNPKSGSATSLTELEKRCFGEPVIESLEQLRAFVAEANWDEVLRRLMNIRLRLQRIDPKLARRLTDVVYEPMIREVTAYEYREAMALAKEFHRVAEPLAIDPHWNRFWALVWEGPIGSLEDAERYWRKYLKDLENLPILSPDERRLAQALVLEHMGQEHVGYVEFLEGHSDPFSRPASKQEIGRERKEAVAIFEESLRLAPTHPGTYRHLIDAYEDWGQPDEAAAVARRLLEKVPDDFDALEQLAEHFSRRDAPAQALEYVTRARALKPLDPDLVREEWTIRMSLARHCALEKKWDEGRAQFSAAERVWAEGSQSFHGQAQRIVFELKAHQNERADEMIRDAQERSTEAAPLWLALWVEASRYKLPQIEQVRFDLNWEKALPKRCRSDTAGAIASLLHTFIDRRIDYPNREQHIRDVVQYLQRTTRIKYTEHDLESVCTFLVDLPKEKPLLDKLLQRGLKLFPDSPRFLWMAGLQEMAKGPRQSNMGQARKYFEAALKHAQASRDPKKTALISDIQEDLSRLRDLMSHPLGMAFGGGRLPDGVPPGFRDLLDRLADEMGAYPNEFFEDDFDDDDEFDDDEDDDSSYSPPPRKRASGKKKKKG